jgi:energy-converting hydrogenase Eha subunit F
MSAAIVTKFTEVLYVLVPAALMLLGIVLASKLKAKKLTPIPIPVRRSNP